MASVINERQATKGFFAHLGIGGQGVPKQGLAQATDHLTVCLTDLTMAKPGAESYAIILKHAVAEVQATGGYFLSGDAEDDNLKAEAAYSPAGSFPFPEVVKKENTLSGQVFTTDEAILVRATRHDEVSQNEFGSSAKAALCVPLSVLGTPCMGVMTIVSTKSPEAFRPQQLARVQCFGSVLAMVLLNEKTEKFRRSTIVQTLESMSAYLEAKDPLTAGHSLRVAKISVEIAKRLNLTPEVLEHLRIGAILMDLGNVSVPDSIMKKPGVLTPEEFGVIRLHAAVSFEICKKLQLPEEVLMLVRNHHERLDGSGYPDQLRSAEISLPLRILCVADAYDAMRCARPHRDGMTELAAVKQLNLEAGTKFDPLVVQALRDLVDAGSLAHLHRSRAA